MTIYKAVVELEEKNNTGVLCTIIHSKGSTPRHATSKMLVYPDGHIIGTVGGGEVESRVIKEALEAIKDGIPRLLSYNMADPARGDPGVCGGQVEIYVEPIVPKPVLVVIGAGHVGKAVVFLAKWLGFVVVVSDDRVEFCNPEALPGADQYYPIPLDKLASSMEINPWTYMVLTTRGVDIDVGGLPSLLTSNAAYIGVIGSKRRWATTVKKLADMKIDPELVKKVHSPIGLEIHAETPEEIAVSIMAEIIKLHAH
jgi:xanthine dehydrogenase accessory factor